MYEKAFSSQNNSLVKGIKFVGVNKNKSSLLTISKKKEKKEEVLIIKL